MSDQDAEPLGVGPHGIRGGVGWVDAVTPPWWWPVFISDTRAHADVGSRWPDPLGFLREARNPGFGYQKKTRLQLNILKPLRGTSRISPEASGDLRSE